MRADSNTAVLDGVRRQNDMLMVLVMLVLVVVGDWAGGWVGE